MNIQFTIKNETTLLRADASNYELCKQVTRTDKTTGQKVQEWEPFKFFSSLEQALNKIIDLKIRTSEAKTLAELKHAVESARNEVCRVWDTSVKGAEV